MPRPMRLYRSPDLRCVVCDRAIFLDQHGSWQHRIRVGVTKTAWHLAKVQP
jgi:hypothetical protein